MGLTHVTALVRNPAKPDQTYEALFLVDTGSVDSVVPRNRLKEIGLTPQGQRTYELANQQHVTYEATTAQIEFMGEFVGTTVVFGEADCEPFLGVTALESVGIMVDPLTQALKRRPAVPMKATTPARQ